MYLTNCSIFQKPGNVKLHPELLSKHQKYVAEKIGSSDPVRTIFLRRRNMYHVSKICGYGISCNYQSDVSLLSRFHQMAIGLLHRYRSLKDF